MNTERSMTSRPWSAAAVASHVSYAARAAHGGAARHRGRALAETAARAAIVPGALGVAVGAFNGVWWGLAAGALGYLLRLGVIAEYRAGGRSAATGHPHRPVARGGRRAGCSGRPAHACAGAGAASDLLVRRPPTSYRTGPGQGRP